MSKITLNNVADLTQPITAAQVINTNSATIQTAFDNTLSRDGTGPNTMGADLDMNSHRILNLPAAAANNDPVRLVDIINMGGNPTVAAIPVGGTTGQQLTKNSNANFDIKWSNAPTGSVSSVGLAMPADFTITNSPVTVSGTLTAAWANAPTGTGSVVRNTSPALITPSLGVATTTTINGATVPTTVDTLVARNTTDTLTNKTLTSPVISTITNTGTITLPTSTDTLVGRITTDTLQNKTISGSNNTLQNIALSSHATQSANTIVGNFTGSPASPTASAIGSLTQKASPTSSDLIMIQDQAASGQLKYATVSAIASAGSVASIGGLTGTVTLGNGLSTSANNVILNSGTFIVDRNGTNQTGLTAATDNKIQFNNKVKDVNSWFDATTNFRYTPQVAGTYQIALGVSSNVGTSGETCQAAIYKNGAAVKRSSYLTASTAASYNAEVVAYIPMNGTTDYIEGFVYVPASQTTLLGSTLATHMEGHRVGD